MTTPAEFAESLRRRGVVDDRVAAAFAAVDRAAFMPPELRATAYLDAARPIAGGQTISQPSLVAAMTAALELTGGETVLEIGAGSGYQAAILARLCDRVVSVERLPELAAAAERALRDQGIGNVTVRVGDGTLGSPADAPYDAAIVTAAAPDVPPALLDQLAVGGRLVIPVGPRTEQDLLRLRKTADGVARERLLGCRFVPLIGERGWDA